MWEMILSGLRVFYAGIVTMTIATLTTDKLLERRRSLAPILLYFYGKLLFQQVVIGEFGRHFFGDTAWWKMGYAILMYILAIVTYLMYCYTFRGDFLKIAMGAWIGELTAMFLGQLAFVFTNFLEGRADLLPLYARPHPLDIFIYIIGFGSWFFFCCSLRSVMAKFRSHTIRHCKFFWTLFISYIFLATAGSYLYGTDDMFMNCLMGILYVGCAMIPAFVMCTVYKDTLEVQNNYLKLQENLVESHYTAMQGQVRNLEEKRRELDRNMAEMETYIRKGGESGREEDETKRARIKVYIRELRRVYEEAGPGLYCRDWKIDSLIFSKEKRAKKLGIRFTCSLKGYETGAVEEEDLAALLLLALDWGIEKNQCKNVPEKERKLDLNMTTIKGQVILRMVIPDGRGKRLPAGKMRRIVKKYNGSIRNEKKGEQREVAVSLSC